MEESLVNYIRSDMSSYRDERRTTNMPTYCRDLVEVGRRPIDISTPWN